MEVRDIIKDARVITEDTTFAEALTIMIRANTNSLLVADDNGTLCGELSVADLLDAIIPHDIDGDTVTNSLSEESAFAALIGTAKDQLVGDFMNTDYDAIHPDDGLMTIAAIAIAHQRARIPVTDHDGRPIGIISRQGLKQILAQYLENTPT